jgi:hypothetical protein
MTQYEKMVATANTYGIEVYELEEFRGRSGFYSDNVIMLNKDLTDKEKYCIMFEELGHHFTTVGDISDQTKIENRKQEVIARRWSYEKIIGIVDLINAHNNGCKNNYEVAEYLNVTEELLKEVLEYYKCKYPGYFKIDNYYLIFNNGLEIIEKFQFKYIE